METKEYLRGIRKGKNIALKYFYRTQDPQFVEVVNEFKEILREKLIVKNEIEVRRV